MVVSAITKGSFRRYLALNIYMLASIFVSIVRFRILFTYGVASPEYGYERPIPWKDHASFRFVALRSAENAIARVAS